MSGRARFAGALALLLLPWLVIFRRALFFGETFVERDLAAYYRPAKTLVARLWAEAPGLPLWNPYFASGQPFAANPEHEIWHPLTALFLVLPFEWAFRLQVLVPPLVAVASCFFLLRTVRRTRTAALFGALSWGYGGYLLSTSNLLPCLFAAAVLPAVLAFALRFVRSGSAKDGAGAAAALALVALAGEPAALMITLGLVGVTAAAESIRSPAVGRSRRLAALLAVVALGLAAGAATLLPGFQHAAKTVRAAGLPSDVALQWSFPPIRLVEFFVPDFLGRVDSAGGLDYRGAPLYPGRGFPFIYSIYPGFLVSVLALVETIRANRRRLLWPGLFVSGFLFACGGHLPLWPAIRQTISPLRGLRYPEKFMLVPCLAVVVLGAAGYDRVTRGRSRSASGRRLPQSGVGLLMLGTLAAELSWRGPRLAATEPIAHVSTPPALLRPALVLPLSGPLFNYAARSRRAGAHGEVVSARSLAAPPIPVQWGVASTLEVDFDLTELAWSSRAASAAWTALREEPELAGPILARRGVAAVVRPKPGGLPGFELAVPTTPAPFAFLAESVVQASGADGWRRAVSSLGSRAARAVVLESGAIAPMEPSSGDVSVLENRPGRLRLRTRSSGPALLAVNQTWDAGWAARIDGTPSPALRADLSLLAIALPSGEHVVELVYRDPWVLAGIALSAASLLTLFGLVTFSRRSAPG